MARMDTEIPRLQRQLNSLSGEDRKNADRAIAQLTNKILSGALSKNKEYYDSIESGKTHTQNHYGHSELGIMNRMFNKEKMSHSEFSSKETADFCISNLIKFNVKNIALWIYFTPEFDPVSHKRNAIELTRQTGGPSTDESGNREEDAGYGYRMTGSGKIHKYRTGFTTLILERNDDPKRNGYGFTIMTAYPDIMHHGKIITDDCTPVLLKTKIYQNAKPMQRIFLEKATDDNWTPHLSYNQKTDSIHMIISRKNETPVTEAVFYKDQRTIEQNGKICGNADTIIPNQYPNQEGNYLHLKYLVEKVYLPKVKTSYRRITSDQTEKSTEPTKDPQSQNTEPDYP